MRRVTLISTGGTIEKTYDEVTGTLSNRSSIVSQMLRGLRLEDTRLCLISLMSKDSLDLTDEDRRKIVETVAPLAAEEDHGVVVLHGTDTLCVTGELLVEALGEIRSPVILTGAMRPYEMKDSDALQNLTEAILASGFLEPGVYVVAHGRVLRFPGVVKDREHGTFVRTD